MKELKDIILSAQNFDETAMQEVVEKFEPAINGYTRKMKNDEDFRSDITLYLIELIRNLNITSLRLQNDYALINYISCSLYHQYIRLSQRNAKIRSHENYFDDEDIEKWLGIDYGTADSLDDMMTETIMKNLLSERECSCVKLMVIDGMTSSEAAEVLGIARQTVNEAKLRGLKKLVFGVSKRE